MFSSTRMHIYALLQHVNQVASISLYESVLCKPDVTHLNTQICEPITALAACCNNQLSNPALAKRKCVGIALHRTLLGSVSITSMWQTQTSTCARVLPPQHCPQRFVVDSSAALSTRWLWARCSCCRRGSPWWRGRGSSCGSGARWCASGFRGGGALRHEWRRCKLQWLTNGLWG